MTTSTDAAETPTAALAMRGIDIIFTRSGQEPLTIVTGFNLDVARGSMHCLAGRSGSGKTSVLRVAVALTAPVRGKVYWNGQRVDRLDSRDLARARRSGTSYVDQGGTVIDQLTALDNVLLPAVPTGIDRTTEARARDLLDLFGLSRHAKHAAATLSGGERHRLALARALLPNPRLIAIDEPTASLDRTAADSVIAALLSVTNEGVGVLAASHDPSLIAAATMITQLE